MKRHLRHTNACDQSLACIDHNRRSPLRIAGKSFCQQFLMMTTIIEMTTIEPAYAAASSCNQQTLQFSRRRGFCLRVQPILSGGSKTMSEDHVRHRCIAIQCKCLHRLGS